MKFRTATTAIIIAWFSTLCLCAQTTKPLVLNRAGTKYYAGFTRASTVLSNGTTVIVGAKLLQKEHHTETGFITFIRSDGSLIKEVLLGEGVKGGCKMKGIIAEPGTDNVYAIGSTILQTGRFKSNEMYDYDAILVKLDRNGNILWHKVFGSRHTDRIKQLCFTPEGNIATFGKEGKTRSVSETTMRIFSPSGQMLSRKVLPFGEKDYIMHTCSAKGGGYWFAVGTSVKNEKNHDIIAMPTLHRINAAGQKVAQTAIRGSGRNIINDLTETNDGQVLLAMTSYSNDGDFIGTGHYVLSFDQQAQMQWRQHFLIDSPEIHTIKIAANEQGEIYCAFNVRSVVPEFPLKVVGILNVWLAKLDRNGGLVSKKRLDALGHFTECVDIHCHQGTLRMSIDGVPKRKTSTYVPHDVWFCSVAEF